MMICTKSSPTWRACIIISLLVWHFDTFCANMFGPQQTSQGTCCQPCVLHTRHVCYYPHTAPHPIPFVQYIAVVADMSPCVLHTDTYVSIPHPTPSPPQYTPLKKWTPPRLWKYVSPKTWFLCNRIAGSTCFLNQNFWVLPVTLGTPFCNWDFQDRVTVSEHFQACWHIKGNTVYHILLAFKASVYTAVKWNRFCWRVFIRCLFHNSSLETVWFLRPFWARF